MRRVLLVEVEEGAAPLADELARRGLDPRPHQRALLVPLAGDATYDAVRDAVADLRLPLDGWSSGGTAWRNCSATPRARLATTEVPDVR